MCTLFSKPVQPKISLYRFFAASRWTSLIQMANTHSLTPKFGSILRFRNLWRPNFLEGAVIFHPPKEKRHAARLHVFHFIALELFG